MNRKLRGPLVSLATLLACLAAGEVAVRLLSTAEPRRLVYEEHKIAVDSPLEGLLAEPRPGSSGLMASVPVRINAQGFRGRPVPLARARDSLRVVALGDSFTFGVGVTAEQAYPALLEQRLRRRAGPGPVEVLNLGVPGYDSVEQVIYFRERGLRFAPDLVIVGFFLNDAVSKAAEERYLESVQGIIGLLRDPPLPLRLSRLLFFLTREYFFFAETDNIVQHFKSAYSGADTRHWEACVAALRQLSRLGRAEGFRVLVAVLPVLMGHPGHNDFQDYAFADVHALVRARLQQEGLAVVDLLDTFREHSFEPLAIPLDGHPSPRGQRVIAGGILRALERRGWIP